MAEPSLKPVAQAKILIPDIQRPLLRFVTNRRTSASIFDHWPHWALFRPFD
jgi:hypothetical protein